MKKEAPFHCGSGFFVLLWVMKKQFKELSAYGKAEFINAVIDDLVNKKKQQGWNMSHKKRQMYEMGINDAIIRLFDEN
jgi:hypothetical protein